MNGEQTRRRTQQAVNKTQPAAARETAPPIPPAPAEVGKASTNITLDLQGTSPPPSAPSTPSLNTTEPSGQAQTTSSPQGPLLGSDAPSTPNYCSTSQLNPASQQQLMSNAALHSCPLVGF